MTSPFVWHELLTPDPAAARAFYAGLLGWELGGGNLAAGVRKSGLHPHWAPFVRVPDPDAAAARAPALGGRVAGRSASPPGIVLVDARGVPTVASSSAGSDLFGWHILESTDVGASAEWIAGIAGFSVPERGGLWRGEEQVGSLVSAAHDRWLGLVVVSPTGGAVSRRALRARAVALGAAIEREDVDAAGNGTYDVVLDPTGAAFCLFE